ncbi:hypothetical protein T484DRAFT_1954079 [Baffinella frigidus]|nr:hypothetical protein T484DRAFT_1954079 [Cryptophyta sp. CCMP2293]
MGLSGWGLVAPPRPFPLGLPKRMPKGDAEVEFDRMMRAHRPSVWEDKGATTEEFRSLKEVARDRVKIAATNLEGSNSRRHSSSGSEDDYGTEEAHVNENHPQKLSVFEKAVAADKEEKRIKKEARKKREAVSAANAAAKHGKRIVARHAADGKFFDEFMRSTGGGKQPGAGSTGPRRALSSMQGDKFSPANQMRHLHELWAQEDKPQWGKSGSKDECGRVFGEFGKRSHGLGTSLRRSERAASISERERENMEVVETIMRQMPQTAGGSLRLPTGRQRRLADENTLPLLPDKRLPGDVKAKAASLYEAKLNSLKNARNAGGDHVQPHKVFMS